MVYRPERQGGHCSHCGPHKSLVNRQNPGDVKPVGENVSELRIDYGPGYRVYFIQRGPVLVVLLAGGDKRTQATDIKRAIAISKEWRD
jgi:putative addiction module killer protein